MEFQKHRCGEAAAENRSERGVKLKYGECRVSMKDKKKFILQGLKKILEEGKNYEDVQEFMDMTSRIALDDTEIAADLTLLYHIYNSLYIDFCKPNESIETYRMMANFGMKISRIHQSTKQYIQSNDCKGVFHKIIFVIDSDSWLGHLQILSSFIQKSTAEARKCIEILSISGKRDSFFANKMAKFGIAYKIIYKVDFSEKIKVLTNYIQKLNAHGINCKLIWTAWPPLMFLGGCMRLTHRQSMWAMKYPYPLGCNIDEVYFAYGFQKNTKGKFYVHDSFQPLFSHPFYLTTDALASKEENSLMDECTEKGRQIMRDLKKKGRILILSAARPEKMSNNIFINRLKSILKANQSSVFIWCGKPNEKSVKTFQRYLEEYNIAERTLFTGWVYTWEIIQEVDYFLDTYPFGSGVTLAQAIRQQKHIILHNQERMKNRIDSTIDSFVINEPNYSEIIQQVCSGNNQNITIISDDLKKINFSQSTKISRRYPDLFAPSSAVHKALSQLLFC